MRYKKQGGRCSDCGVQNGFDVFWASNATPNDIAAFMAERGIAASSELVPIEETFSQPERCDNCESEARERRQVESIERMKAARDRLKTFTGGTF